MFSAPQTCFEPRVRIPRNIGSSRIPSEVAVRVVEQ